MEEDAGGDRLVVSSNHVATAASDVMELNTPRLSGEGEAEPLRRSVLKR